MFARLFDKKDDRAEPEEGHQGSLLDLFAATPATPTKQVSPTESLLSAIGQAEREAQKRQLSEEAEKMALLAEYRAKREAHHAQSHKSDTAPVEDNRQARARQLDLLADKLALMKESRQSATVSLAEDKRNEKTETASPQVSHTSPPNPQNSVPIEAHEPFLSFNSVIRKLFEKWKRVFFFGLIGAAVAAVYSLTLPNMYESVAEVLIEPRGLKIVDNSVTPTGLNSEATIAFAESQVRIINSSSVIDRVIDDLELYEDPEFTGKSVSTSTIGRFLALIFGSGANEGDGRSQAKTYLYDNFYAARINQTFTIQIGVSTADPDKSARVANAIARAYMNDEAGARSTAARSVSRDLNGRIGELRDMVRKSEEAVERYKAENGLVDSEGKFVSEVQLSRLNEQLALAKVQAGDARTRAELAAEADLSDVIAGSLPSALASNTISQLRVEYFRAKSRLDRVSTRLGERHPDRIGARSELASARDAIAQEIRRTIQSTQEEFKRASARLADLQSQVNTLKSSAVTDSAAKVRLRALNREVDANRRVFETFLLRSRETGEQENIQSKSARIISEAAPAIQKNGPNRKLIVVIGGVLGGAAGVTLALLPWILFGFRDGLLIGGPSRPAPTMRESADDLYGAPEPLLEPAHQQRDQEPRSVSRAWSNISESSGPTSAEPATAPEQSQVEPQPAKPQAVTAEQPLPQAQPAPSYQQPTPPQPAPPQPVQMPLPGFAPAQPASAYAVSQPMYHPGMPMTQPMAQPMPQPMPVMQPQPVYYPTYQQPIYTPYAPPPAPYPTPGKED